MTEYAEGGPIKGSTIYRVGEHGPEYLIPLRYMPPEQGAHVILQHAKAFVGALLSLASAVTVALADGNVSFTEAKIITAAVVAAVVSFVAIWATPNKEVAP